MRLSVTDLFISMRPVTHPTRSNFTWFQSKYGADSITLQYTDMARHCVPRPTVTGGDCDIYIGVYGWQNTSFTVLASVDEGFRSPITLLDQAPQSGHVDNSGYMYYRYAISAPQSSSGIPPTNIRFSLTPTGRCHDTVLNKTSAPSDADHLAVCYSQQMTEMPTYFY
jgi:hypothetical protein